MLCPALCATLRASSPERPLLDEELGAAAKRLQGKLLNGIPLSEIKRCFFLVSRSSEPWKVCLQIRSRAGCFPGWSVQLVVVSHFRSRRTPDNQLTFKIEGKNCNLTQILLPSLGQFVRRFSLATLGYYETLDVLRARGFATFDTRP